MIYNTNKIFGKVWDVKVAENGKYMDLQMTTSEKDAEGNYVNSGWFPRAIGHAVNSLKGLKKGDRITITKSKFTNERYTDNDGNTKSRFRFLILEATIEASDAPASTDNTTKASTVAEAPASTSDDSCPW